MIGRGGRAPSSAWHILKKPIVEDFYEQYEESRNEGKPSNDFEDVSDSKIPKTNHASSNMGRKPTAMETNMGWRPHDTKAHQADARYSINSIADSEVAEDMLLQKMGFTGDYVRASQ